MLTVDVEGSPRAVLTIVVDGDDLHLGLSRAPSYSEALLTDPTSPLNWLDSLTVHSSPELLDRNMVTRRLRSDEESADSSYVHWTKALKTYDHFSFLYGRRFPLMSSEWPEAHSSYKTHNLGSYDSSTTNLTMVVFVGNAGRRLEHPEENSGIAYSSFTVGHYEVLVLTALYGERTIEHGATLYKATRFTDYYFEAGVRSQGDRDFDGVCDAVVSDEFLESEAAFRHEIDVRWGSRMGNRLNQTSLISCFEPT